MKNYQMFVKIDLKRFEENHLYCFVRASDYSHKNLLLFVEEHIWLKSSNVIVKRYTDEYRNKSTKEIIKAYRTL